MKFSIIIPQERSELLEFAELSAQSLFFPHTHLDHFIAREGAENFRLATIKGRTVAGLAVQRMGQWFGGNSIPTGAVRVVAVAPEWRSRGIASQLLKHMLDELRRDGIPLATLYPSTQSVYRRAGFVRAGVHIIYRYAIGDIDIHAKAPEIESVSTEDSAIFREMYAIRAKNGNGNLDRSEWLWQRILHNIFVDRCYAYCVRQNGENTGYIVYSQKLGTLEQREMVIQDLVVLTKEAGERILSFIGGHQSMVRHFSWSGGPDEPLFDLLANPNCQVQEMYPWMLRIVDVAKALERKGYGAVREKIEIEVKDDVLPWNNGHFILDIRDGKAAVRSGGSGKIKIDIRGLAALYSGFLSPWQLQTIGYLVGDSGELTKAAHIFAGAAPWMPDMF